MDSRKYLIQKKVRAVQISLWVGIAVNLTFAIPAIFLTETFSEWMELGPLSYSIWLQTVGMLLIIISAFLYVAAKNPLENRMLAWAAAGTRTFEAIFWLILSTRSDYPNSVCLMFWTDTAIAVFQVIALVKLSSVENYSVKLKKGPGIIGALIGLVFETIFKWVNKIIPWHKLPTMISILNLITFRNALRKHNLHDTSQLENPVHRPLEGKAQISVRSSDGSYNDLNSPGMGASLTRFGRNFKLGSTWPDGDKLMVPNPREISRKLMTRDSFKPATTLNLLAAAWIQFMNHGWQNHQRSENENDVIKIPLDKDDNWPGKRDSENSMPIRKTQADPTRHPASSGPPTFLNTESHWWDASQLYGSSLAKQSSLRQGKGGCLKIEPDGLLPLDPDPILKNGVDLTGFNDNWWMGLALLHTIFAKEHNYICDELKKKYPEYSNNDEWLFQKARLINAALLAKIHTVEWTPGILGSPALKIAMDANWFGMLHTLGIKTFDPKRGKKGEVLYGIPGSPTDHHTAPFYLTEEFTSVYRMHPLIPDEIVIWDFETGHEIKQFSLTEVQGIFTRNSVNSARMEDLFYSYGFSNPGAITLHNFPKTLQHFTRANGEEFDLAAVDILRDRERGVPRYNDFREMLRMPRIKSFDELTNNKDWANQIKEVYGGKIDEVDALIGMFAEPLPEGFGFSDTAFRIFIVMASRRLKSDRFFTEDYNAKIYTEFGINHIETNLMNTVILRHHPELQSALEGVKNTFAPWNKTNP